MGILDWFRPGSRQADKPQPGQIARPDADDWVRQYVSAGLTPEKVVTALKAYDAGDFAIAMHLMEQMEEKDLHLQSVATTRRNALTGLQWEIVSAADVHDIPDRNAADEAAAYCREVLAGLDGIDETLEHLALGIGRGVSIAELIWEGRGKTFALVDLVEVAFPRIRCDLAGTQATLRVTTAENLYPGVALDWNKWIVHTPHSATGLPIRGGLLPGTAWMYLAKLLGVKFWAIFCERFGLPVRIARYEPNTTPADQAKILTMLQGMSSDVCGVFSKGVEIEMKEAQDRGQQPYEAMADWCDRQVSKGWLGQTLTTDTTQATGTYAAAQVHDEVRKDLRDADMRIEARTLRRDLLRPLTQLRLGEGVPVPFWRRRLAEITDPLRTSQVADSAVNRLGLRISRTWLMAELGVKEATGEDDVVPGQPAPANPFGFGPDNGQFPAPAGDDEPQANRRGPCGCRGEETIAHATAAAPAWVQEGIRQVKPLSDAAMGALNDALVEAFDEEYSRGGEQTDPSNVWRAWAADPASRQANLVLVRATAGLCLLAYLQGGLGLRQYLGARRRSVRQAHAQPPQRASNEEMLRILAEELGLPEGNPTGFVRLPFEEAIAAATQRLEITKGRFLELTTAMRSRCFTLWQVARVQQVAEVHQAWLTQLRQGGTLRDFRNSLPSMLAKNGWSGEDWWHANVVFFQNSKMASEAGSYQQMREAGVGYWRFVKNTERHAALDGKVFKATDTTYWPPIDFLCDCGSEPVFEDEVDPREVTTSDRERTRTGIGYGKQPRDFGWDVQNYLQGGSIPLPQVPAELQPVVRDLAGQQGIGVDQ